MAFVGDTGHGATLTLATTGAVGCVRSMELPSWDMEKIDASCLDTVTYMHWVAADLVDPGDVVSTHVFDPRIDIPVQGQQEIVTVTFPLAETGNTPATLAGTAFIQNIQLPTLESNSLMELEITIAWVGDDITFTPEATP